MTKITPDGPAFQSKEIFPGDILIQVNGALLEGMSLEQVWSFIIGPPNTRVDLQFLRTNELDDAEEMEEVYVSIFRSSVASPNINESAKFPRLFSKSPGQRDTSLPRSSRARSSDVQHVSPFSQISPNRDPVSVYLLYEIAEDSTFFRNSGVYARESLGIANSSFRTQRHFSFAASRPADFICGALIQSQQAMVSWFSIAGFSSTFSGIFWNRCFGNTTRPQASVAKERHSTQK